MHHAHEQRSYHPGEDEDPTNKFAIIRTKSIRSGAQRNKVCVCVCCTCVWLIAC
jgi:hypothetical protein